MMYNDSMAKSKFYNTEEAMALLKISRITLYRWVKSGRLPASKVGSTYRFLKEDIDRYLLGRPVIVAQDVITAPSRTPLDITARDIADWSARGNKAAQSLLPELVRRLIDESRPRITLTKVHIPIGDATSQAGWDGMVTAKGEDRYIPNGASAWEMGVGEPAGKAQGDYVKRTKTPINVKPKETTFTFVTTQDWPEGSAWITRKKKETNYSWKDIRVLDATDLEAWIEVSPATKAWFMKKLGRPQYGVMDIESYWNKWRTETNPPMSRGVVVAGRQKQEKALLEQLEGRGSNAVTVVANSAKEAVAFIAATIMGLLDEKYGEYASSILVVETEEAWNEVVASAPTPLVLIPAFTDIDGYSEAISKGHTVVNALDKSANYDKESAIILATPRRHDVKDELVKMGVPEKQAEDFAPQGRSSIQSLWRRLAIVPSIQRPEWASDHSALIPSMLIGKWSEKRDDDKRVLSLLAGVDYEKFTNQFDEASRKPDAPVGHVGDIRYVVSKDDLWGILYDRVTATQVAAFINIATEVFCESDPAYDLPLEDRWAASIHDKNRLFSSELRESLADTLAYLASKHGSDVIGGSTGQQIADAVVRQIYEAAKNDDTGRIWASLHDVVYLLAEASPAEFLSALERDLKNNPAKMKFLFQDDKKLDSFFSGTSPHIGFLNALEGPAWLPEYLLRSAYCLARLHGIDPGGSYANRPLASLKDIFLTWHPQTHASIQERVDVLDALATKYPEVVWPLLLALLPGRQEFTTGTYKPRWREWAGEDKNVTFSDMHQMVDEITTMLMNMVGDDIARLTDLIDDLSTLPSDAQKQLAAKLESLDLTVLNTKDRLTLWEHLKEVVYHNRRYAKQSWAMKPEQLDLFDSTLTYLEPSSITEQAISLFKHRVELPMGDSSWKKYEASVKKARDKMAAAVYEEEGLELIFSLADKVEAPYYLGGSLIRTTTLSDDEYDSIFHYLADDDNRSSLARGVVHASFYPASWEWVDKVIAELPSLKDPKRLGTFLSYLPVCEKTWAIVDKLSPEARQRYWEQCIPYTENDTVDYQRLATELINVGRSYAAIETLSNSLRENPIKPTKEIVFKAIEGFLQAPSDGTKYDQTMFRYHAKRLLNYLYKAIDSDDKTRLAQIEWPMLVIMGDEATPRILQEELTANPQFFIDVMKWVYRRKGAERTELTKKQKQEARLGRELLDSWKKIPGDDGNKVDGEKLLAWLDEARQLLTEEGRLEVGEHVIGAVLARSRIDPDDGVWPEKAVREAIEHIESEELAEGIRTALYNRRGATTRAVGEGGGQERILSKKYEGYANGVGVKYPQTQALLRSVSLMWQREAERHDKDALRDEI
ncbi:MAG: DNA-binding protein [Alcaligenaceae bacterium]|nr:MAG: DNA-binding protein [Alcaligenaceae bacterium]